MNRTRWSLALCAALLLAAGLPAGPVCAQALRGFGEVTMEPVTVAGVEGLRFACENEGRAQVLLHKFSRDMSQSATLPARWESLELGGRAVPVLVRPELGSFLPAARGAVVTVFTAPADQVPAAAFAPLAGELGAARFFDPDFRYPVYLDKFSHYGIGSWYPSYWGDRNTEGGKPNTVRDHFAFARQMDLALQPNAGGYLLRNLLPMLHEYGRPYHFAQWQEWSPELAMLCPEELTFPSDLFACMPHYYGQVSDGGHRLMAYQNWQVQERVRRLVDDPLLVDQADPNGEVGPFAQDYFWDFSEANRRNFVRFLQEARGYTLRSLGEAWYGNPRRFRSWDAVPISFDYTLFGWQPDSLQANRSWRVHPGSWEEGLRAGYHQEDCEDSGWVELDLPGGELVSMFWRAQKQMWYRGTMDVPRDWLQRKQRQGRVYLNAAVLTSARGWRNPDRVWVNGQEVAAFSHCPGYSLTGQFDVTDLLRPGQNSLVLLPAHAWWGPCGPFFLTDEPWEDYPFRDTHRNARYADWHDYVAWAVKDMLENTYQAIRGADPDRFIKMHAFEAKYLGIPLAARYGGFGHNTGDEAFFRPWDKRLGYPRGIPASAEPSGSVDDPEHFRRWLGWFTFTGLNALDYFHNIQSMMYSPCAELWQEYLPYFKLAPRRDIRKPDLALLWSSQNNRLLPRPVPYCFDLGRGDLQFIGHSYIYLDEPGIADGLASDYRVVWDTGTWIMSRETVAAIREFVEEGGTFVALQETGRHTPTERDAWPITDLTGFRVREIRPMTGSLSILSEQPLFTQLAGRSFYNRGKSIDYSDHNYADKCLVLDPIARGTQALARYEDGGIAIGMRRLGRGRVIVLGSPFWRDSYDETGMWWPGRGQCEFLEDILAGLGLKPVAVADTYDVWREHYLANNGTEEYLALFNPFREPRTFSLEWTTLNPARGLYDPKNGETIPGTVNGRQVRLENLTLQPLETLLVATQPARPPQEAAQAWFDHLALWWRASAPGKLLERPDLPIYELRLEDRLRARVVTGAAAEQPDPGHLSTLAEPGRDWIPGAAQSPEEFRAIPDATRRCWFHCTFQVPASWGPDDTLTLNVRTFSHGVGNIVGPVDAWLNGRQVLTQANCAAPGYNTLQGGATADLAGLLKPGGENVLLLATGEAGLMGEVRVTREPAPLETLEIAGEWQVQADSGSGLIPAELPGTATGLFAHRDFTVPASWRHDRVFVRLDAGGEFSVFAVNRKMVFHPVNWFPPVRYMDVTPWVQFGETNRLTVISHPAVQRWEPGTLEVRRVTVERVPGRDG